MDSESERPSVTVCPRPASRRYLAPIVLLALVGVAAAAFLVLRRDALRSTAVEKRAAAVRPPRPAVPGPKPVTPKFQEGASSAAPAPVSSAAPAATSATGTAARSAAVQVGDVFDGRITGVGSRGDGSLRLQGKTVYIPGTKSGDALRYRISKDTGSFFIGERVAAETPLTTPSTGASAAPAAQVREQAPGGEAVQVGAEFEVVITEKDRFAPERNGFCRVGGFAVVVENVQPGPKPVRIRITERLERRAKAVVLP